MPDKLQALIAAHGREAVLSAVERIAGRSAGRERTFTHTCPHCGQPHGGATAEGLTNERRD
jgi:hypothetical protein